MTTIAKFSDDNKRVQLNIETLLKTRMFISASSGGGKSETVRALAEKFYGKVQVLILDPEGEFRTLREKYGYVLVGEDGETPAHPRTAGQVAITLLKLGASAVCDLYELKGNGRHEFVASFLKALVDAPKDLWKPVVVFIDEAHTFAPENGYGESMAKQHVIDLCNLGRKRGFCPILVTQRASKISKNASEPLQNFMIGLTMPDDQKRVCDIFKVAPGAPTREFSHSLEILNPGEFYIRGSAFSLTTPRLIVMDRAETQAPKTGKAAAGYKTPTPAEIQHLLPTLKDIPQEVERKALTEKELREKIRTLETEVSRKVVVTPERERMLLETIKTLEQGVKTLQAENEDKTKALVDAVNGLEGIVAKLRDRIFKEGAKAPPPIILTTLARVEQTAREPQPVLQFKPKVEFDGKPITTPMQRIVDAIAWFEAIGVPEPEQPGVAFMANYAYGSGGFNNPRGSLKVIGLIEYLGGDRVKLTDRGRAAANYPEIAPTNSDLHAAIMSKLETPMKRIMQPLLACYPEGMDNDSLAKAANYALGSGGFNNPRGRLKTLGLVEYRDGKVYARDILFPQGK